MKKEYKLIMPIIVAAMLLVSLPFCVSAKEDSRYGRTILSKEANSTALLNAYDTLKKGCENADKSIRIHSKNGENIKSYELNIVFMALFSDYPEYFWLTGGYDYTCNNFTEEVFLVKPEYLFDKSKIASASAALDTISDKLLEGIEGKSEYEKSLIIHDRLAERVIYTETPNDQTAYGAIVEGEAVCSGYAKAYDYLLRKAGMDAWSISGESVNPTTLKKEGHRWNMVKIDGVWYYTDVTWDDQPDFIYHNYFNRTLSYFNTKHFPDSMFKNYLPDDNSTEADFFVKNDIVLQDASVNSLIPLLKNNNNKINFYIANNTEAFEKSLEANIEDIVIKLGARGGATYTYAKTLLGNEMRLNIIIEQHGHNHKLHQIAKIDPTCYTSGREVYYECSCGRCFSDIGAKNEITSTKDLIINRTAHTPSEDWRYTDTAHWKYCTVCDADVADSSDRHTDKDKDLVCEICGGDSPKIKKTFNLLDWYDGPPLVVYSPAIAVPVLTAIIGAIISAIKSKRR